MDQCLWGWPIARGRKRAGWRQNEASVEAETFILLDSVVRVFSRETDRNFHCTSPPQTISGRLHFGYSDPSIAVLLSFAMRNPRSG